MVQLFIYFWMMQIMFLPRDRKHIHNKYTSFKTSNLKLDADDLSIEKHTTIKDTFSMSSKKHDERMYYLSLHACMCTRSNTTKHRLTSKRYFMKNISISFPQVSYCPQRNEKGEILRINFYKVTKWPKLQGLSYAVQCACAFGS